MKTFATIIAAALTLILNQCAPYQYGAAPRSNYLAGFQPAPGQGPISNGGQPQPQGYWDDNGVSGPPSIRIKLNDQRAYFYKGGTLVGVSPISTGTDGHTTPRGSFKVTEKDIDHVSSLYGIIKNKYTGQTINPDADTRKHKAGPGEVFELAPMKYFLRFNGSIGMHAGFLPGYPASHGCIRMPEQMARTYYNNASVGTPVTVE